VRARKSPGSRTSEPRPLGLLVDYLVIARTKKLSNSTSVFNMSEALPSSSDLGNQNQPPDESMTTPVRMVETDIHDPSAREPDV
jgi:hypothetical protein